MSYKFFFFASALNLFYYVPNLLASPVIGGHEDTFNTYKYHVSIHYRHNQGYPNSGELLCGGAIIGDRYVLTAAHCFMIKRNGHIQRTLEPITSGVVVLAGTSKTYGPGIITEVCKVFIPHAYDQGQDTVVARIYGDIAVVELAFDLNVASNTNIMEIIPLDPGLPLDFFETKYALVPGNGCDTAYRGYDGVWRTQLNKYADTRQVLEVKMLERNLCPFFDYSICALNFDRSQIHACSKGDSGSPLVYGRTIIGVFSNGPDVFRNNFRMVFTRVTIFIDFIMDAINEHGDHSQMYILNH